MKNLIEGAQEMSLDALIKKAQAFYEGGIRWHNHFLTPNCVFNKSKSYVVVLEDETNGAVYYSSMREKPTDAMKEIEKLFYRSIEERGL